ncbi:DUF3800 domain-containing protein [Limisphaera sp. VF-2]|jgi:hypothetical protein|uniref:DUF3800 domain-containing protein n=1 Tax=Limisphaera sp. VF-2 TaxID=3400418 RepID=UPI001753A9EA|nr:DUF3800 domain-containing protein [Limisphaera sp.]
MTPTVTHVGFSDESNWNAGRFRSLALATASVEGVGHLEAGPNGLLAKSDVKEFKWKKLDAAKERFAAEEMCRFAIENASARRLRIDVLVWDIEDTRHKMVGRDDTANLERMYYHVFRNVLRARWPNDAVWRLHPDEHTALDWGTIEDCLEAKSVTVEVDDSLWSGSSFQIGIRREFGIEEIRPVSSKEYPLLQLADLFAGLPAFSRGKYEKYELWLESQSLQMNWFNDSQQPQKLSPSERQHFEVLKMFDQECKKRKLGVSLKSGRGLWTPNPENPINFWIYEPQHPEDKAPVRGAGL